MIKDDPTLDAELDKLGAELLSQSEPSLTSSVEEPEVTTPAADEPTDVEASEPDQPDHSESTPEVNDLSKPERKRDVQGRFIKADGSVDENQEETQPTSEYETKKAERKAKQQARLDKTWQNVEARKEELSQYEQQIQQYEAQVRAAALQQQGQVRARAAGQYSAREVWDAGNEFNQRAIQAFKDGDYEEGDKNNSLAQEAWKHSQELNQRESQTVQQTRSQQFMAAQHQLMQQMIEQDEELGNAESPISKAVQGVMGDEKLWTKLRMFPDAFPMAVELGKLHIKAGAASEWKEKYNKAEAELTRLRRATTPLGSSASTVPSGQRSIDNMSAEQIDRELEKLEKQAWREDTAFA